jgi:hypothetical protein
VLTGSKAADDVEDSLPLKLLADVRSLWPAGTAHMATATLLERLKEIPDSPWTDYGKNGLNVRALSRMLRPFGVEPRQVRTVAGNLKGYQLAELEQAFTRYLPAVCVVSETSDTTRVNTGDNGDS